MIGLGGIPGLVWLDLQFPLPTFPNYSISNPPFALPDPRMLQQSTLDANAALRDESVV
jgi:hypothetical protein